MPRKSVEVNKELLTRCVQKAEDGNTFSTQQDLWQKVAELYNAESDTPVTKSVVYLRVKEWQIPFKTKSARGRRKGSKISDEQKAKMQAARKGKSVRFTSDAAVESIGLLRERTPKRFHSLVDRIAKGSRAAAQKLFCIECCGHQPAEVKKCTSVGCPSYLFRPYQTSEDNDIDDASPENAEEKVEATA